MIAPHHGPLPDHLAAAVRALHARAEEEDGVPPLNEDTLLGLRAPGRVHHLALEDDRPDDDALVGYAQVDPVGGGLELVVRPDRRRRGVGSDLLRASRATTGSAGVATVWSHGDLPAARAFAGAHALQPVRRLHRMVVPLSSPVEVSGRQATVALRAFRPGEDDKAWVALNAAAFSHHPEQGRLRLDDLHARMAEPWFDPAGLQFAVTGDGALAGFVWTKVAPAAGDGTIGEIYVVGVHPDHQGRGLGATLTGAGLDHLRGLGLDRAMLYVDGDNDAALRLYTRLGFGVASTDVQYRIPVPPT